MIEHARETLVELAKDLYDDGWEVALRQLIRDVLGKSVSIDKLSHSEINRLCAELMRI
jgi:hypothetical protein